MKPRIFVLCSCLYLLSSGILCAQTSYFPVGSFNVNRQWDRHTSKFYGSHLMMLKEPSFWSASKKPNNHIYRLLVLPTWGPPTSVRINIANDGAASMVAKVTNAAGGYDPPKSTKIIKYQLRHLSKQEAANVLHKMVKLKVWTKPRNDNSLPRMLDGTSYILESANGGKYRLLNLNDPLRTNVEKFVHFLLQLGQVEYDNP